MNEKRMFFKKISELDFAIIELHLFLDTHPEDISAENKLKEYKKEKEELIKKYEEKYGLIKFKNTSGLPWITSKWPWELEREVY